ncbi:MAG: caspase family protein, partial [Thermoanaerobaculia bacterium]|nr:caspase family protein [Thermoanaerobaculia bacterium]
KVSVFINGKEVKEEANPPKGFDKIRDTAMMIDLDQYARYFLIDSLNTISIRAYNAAGWLKSAPHSVEFWSVPNQAKGDNKSRSVASDRQYRRPALHVIAVGTADYAGEQLDLKYSGKDARDMAGALRQIGTQLFSRDSVFIQLLTTDSSDATLQPTKANIRLAFDTIKKRAKAEDIVVVYFSGHGIAYGDADRALFYYLTREIGSFDLSDVGVRNKRAISSDTLTRWINDIPAQKQVLILDACNSGKVVENLAGSQKSLSASQIRALDRMKDRTGMFVLTGSAADKVSYEAGQFGQGLLTYSLLEGIKGEVPDKFGHVDVMKLFRYACERVPELAKGIGGIQTPVPVGPLGRSFPIGIADSSVHIPIAPEKPVFIRNIFQDEARFNDGLGLTNALKDYLIDQTALGDAPFIYVDVSEYEEAYSIRGLYRMSGDAVEVRGRLFKGKTPVGEAFNVKGKKADVPGLVEAVVDEVMGMVE